MSDIPIITLKYRVDRRENISFQLMMNLRFVRKQYIPDSDLHILTLLSEYDQVDLSTFCETAAEIVYKDTSRLMTKLQNVRNRLVILEKRGFVIKKSKGKKAKVICIAPDIKPITLKAMLVNYKILTIESS
jgi:hypothetical protein